VIPADCADSAFWALVYVMSAITLLVLCLFWLFQRGRR
jgi:hypothetical protein